MKKSAQFAIFVMFFMALVGIASVVGFRYLDKQQHDLFMDEVIKFQSQTATYDADRTYKPGDDISATWKFRPIVWDSPVVMTATFLFRNEDTQRVYLTGQVRVLPFFNEVQYQVSNALDWSPHGYREVTTSYRLPPQLTDGNYTIQICQQFAHDGATTEWRCYDGPKIVVTSEKE